MYLKYLGYTFFEIYIYIGNAFKKYFTQVCSGDYAQATDRFLYSKHKRIRRMKSSVCYVWYVLFMLGECCIVKFDIFDIFADSKTRILYNHIKV